ncbi:amino acid ABC transporter permease [Terrihabitans rhizophilus]|uniref:Amino acid ABC transporter permease n=1 Tax=Terrihabitans rhizophilus TaxID=3092662 RepID=A0ABU4RPC2_9HYPH|nr:amino acid ABC transporter permease [Terrihabitans sp. PJ23]MDX6805944.1 amino acid ABC transporter permease [Terrihabitans sp. PJ23]
MLSQIAYEWPEFATYYNWVFLAGAAGTTLALSALGVILGSVFGLLLAVARISDGRLLLPLRVLAFAFTEIFRRVPFLVTLMLAFFGFQIFFSDVPLFVVAAVTTTFIASAFLSEIIRGGLNSVHRNQWEAAEAMNFSQLQTIRHVILPQAWRVILPPAFGFFVMFIKDTALASQIGVVELTYAAKVLNNKGFSAALAFGVVLLIYFAISYPLARLGAALEIRLAPSRHHRP